MIQKDQKKSGWKKRIFFIFAGMIVFFFAMEAWVRIFRPPPNPPAMFQQHDTRRFSLRPGFIGTNTQGHAIRINSRGLRDRDYPPHPAAGVRRILVLGDSVVFGYGVAGEDTFAGILEKKLNREKKDGKAFFEVINGGIPAYNSELELKFLEQEGLGYHPHMVILCYILNDAEIIDFSRENHFPGPIGAAIREFARLHIRSLFFLRAGIRRLRTGVGRDRTVTDLYGENGEGWMRALAAVKKMNRICMDRGIDYMVVIFPRLDDLSGTSVYVPLYKEIEEKMKDQGIGVLNLFPAFRGHEEQKLWVSSRDRHPNPVANGIAARAIFPYVIRRHR